MRDGDGSRDTIGVEGMDESGDREINSKSPDSLNSLRLSTMSSNSSSLTELNGRGRLTEVRGCGRRNLKFDRQEVTTGFLYGGRRVFSLDR